MKKIVSGIQPTGTMHLGNYLGAVQNWIALQDDSACHFFIADLHSLTEFVPAADRKKSIEDMLLLLMAAGVDVQQTTLFRQSLVPQHAELAWYLMCTARTGWLNRMVQFKDKSGDETSVSAGLYTYPVLQAADILLYGATHVPVGDDQFQHLQLTRDIAQSFNHHYGEVLSMPEPVFTTSPRIMSLYDPTKKMSKSDPNPEHRIEMLDTPDMIRKKYRRATSETEFLPDTVAELENRPAAKNLLTIYSALSGLLLEETVVKFAGQGFGPLKAALTEVTIDALEPIQKRYAELSADRHAALEPTVINALHASAVADVTIGEVKRAVFRD